MKEIERDIERKKIGSKIEKERNVIEKVVIQQERKENREKDKEKQTEI